MMKTFLRLLGFAALFGVSIPQGIAQTSSGQISGRVLDPSGAAVSGAMVTLTNQSTSDVRTDKTEQSGEFIFVAVQPGTFTISITQPDFKKYEKRNLVLHASDRLSTGNIQLEVGTVTESVDVQADQTPIQTESSERSAVLDSKEMSTLMSSSRDVTQLLRVLPGVQKDAGPGGQFGGSQNAGNINGVRGDSNSLSVDGTTGNTRGGPSLDTPANFDSVGEVKVLLNNYQAEYGQAAGAVVELITKSGTRDFHGSVYYYNRNEAYNANAYFNKRTNPVTPRAVSRYNTIGYTIGGPVYIPHLFNTHKDKMFFFFSQEVWPSTTPGGLKYWMMPTALEKQGNFSQSFDKAGNPVRIADPQLIAQGKTCSATNSSGCFPGAIIPASRINTDTQKLLSILPTGNSTYLGVQNGARYNYTTQTPIKRPANTQVLRVDYNITPKWHMYFRGTHTTTEQDGAAVASVTGAMQWGYPFVYSTPGKNASLNLTFIPNANLINEFNIGFAQWSESSRFSNSADLAKFQKDKLGITLGQYNPQINPLNLVPRATWGGSSGFSIGNAPQIQFDNRFPLANDARSWQVQDSITKIWNRHNSKAGFYYQNGLYLQRHIGATFDGQLSFDTNAGSPNDTGYAYANSILGYYNSYTEGSNTVNYAPRWNIIEWFVQDSWKVIPRLTLDYGLRFTYDIPTTLLPNQGAGWVASRYDKTKVPRLYQPYAKGSTRYAVDPGASGAPGSPSNPLLPSVYIGQFVPNSGDYSNGVVVNTDPNYPRSLRNSNGLLVAPRLGFAFDPQGNGKTAIRGGVGLFYNTREGGGTVGDYSLIAPIVYNPVQNYGDAKQFANNCSGASCSSGTTLISPQQTRILQVNRPIETTLSATLGVQQAIGFQSVVDVAYVGTFGRHLSEQIDYNKVPYLSQFDPKNCDSTLKSNTYLNGSVTQCSPLNDNFFRPISGFTNVNLRQYAGTSNYHSLQAQVTRRFARGLQFGIAYTWSKVLTDQDTVSGAVATYQSRRWWDYGLASFDHTNNFVAHWSWDLPKGSALWSNFATRLILDNWQYSGIAEFVTGAPLQSPWTAGSSSTTGTSGGNQLTTGGLNVTGGGDGARAVLIGNPLLPKGQRTVDHYFNASAFALPAVGVVPSATNTPNMLRSTFGHGPGTNNFDMAVNKNFPIREGMMFQIRIEAYNAFNHPSFNKVDTNMVFNANTGAQTSTTFGAINGTRGERQLQLSGRFNF